jgi:phosphoglycolate phosphatase
MDLKNNNIKTILWDWNGTLLDDTHTCIECMNLMLEKRGIPLLTKERYLEIFTFPVREYYLQAGFDFEKEPFEIPAHQFIDLYRDAVLSATLHSHVREVLAYLAGKGYIQAVLSAMERDFLLETMSDKEIMPFFSAVYGIDNHLGAGKSVIAKDLMADLGCDPDFTCLIGDTLHDAEVAMEVGIRCILVANGHQSGQRLEGSGFPVIPTLRDLYRIF